MMFEIQQISPKFSFQESQEDGWRHATTFATVFYLWMLFNVCTVVFARIKCLWYRFFSFRSGRSSTRRRNCSATSAVSSVRTPTSSCVTRGAPGVRARSQSFTSTPPSWSRGRTTWRSRNRSTSHITSRRSTSRCDPGCGWWSWSWIIKSSPKRTFSSLRCRILTVNQSVIRKLYPPIEGRWRCTVMKTSNTWISSWISSIRNSRWELPSWTRLRPARGYWRG